MTRDQDVASKKPLWQRLGWLVLIWALSVAALGVAAWLMRLFMSAAGLTTH
ncbi:DUF2474 domain-containing protein [Pseudomonas putida]|uniref:Cyanide insensitive terminal oxidase, subunit III n=1 Tax=Pseudomonas parafulva TaxID=157782 RepID=A0AAJ0LNN6_9PSED|nr:MULTISPECIES: DUF2474 domain-containing protein [Pseudomonas]AQW67387.1 cyanide insensitive terminal oxidase, subunit III [Pseudomonas parafulva]KTT20311.1 cyanide insensitive terminal oxidase, subunit III [Pseudomonas parafulva]MBA5707147.1 DUF2474 domain-containing protein [Pseudomonas fulva]MBF8636348.1 DUF2474 domain-containing protein [Pseudomonas fulva]MBF8650243.1 DUF2474 domain-containing protein [Pseudomonas putida]